MKQFSILAVALLLVTACAQSPTSGPMAASGESEGTLSLAIGPNVDLILNPDSTTELPILVANAWMEQQDLNLQELAGKAAEQVKLYKPVQIDITESWLTQAGYGKAIPDALNNADFSSMLLEELEMMGMKFRILQSENSFNHLMPMILQDGTIQEMRLTVSEVLLVQEKWIP